MNSATIVSVACHRIMSTDVDVVPNRLNARAHQDPDGGSAWVAINLSNPSGQEKTVAVTVSGGWIEISAAEEESK